MEFTTQPLSIRTVLTPRCFSSIPQAKPVGPAPTPPRPPRRPAPPSEHPFHGGIDLSQRAGKRGWIFAAGLRHIRTPAAFAPDSLRDRTREFSSVDFGREIFSYSGDDRDI